MASRTEDMVASGMIYRTAELGDRRHITSLWSKIFGDEEEISDRLLDDFAGWDNIYVGAEGDRIIAQLLAVPCTSGEHKGAYLYALATDPEYRSRGVMRGLMEYTKRQVNAGGGSFFVLIPAQNSLFGYYENLGFKTVFMANMELSVPDMSARVSQVHVSHRDDYGWGEIPVDLFMELRNKFQDDGLVMFSRDRTSFELEELWYYGCKSVYCRDGYIIYLEVGNTLFITETVAASSQIAQDLISRARRDGDLDTVKATLPLHCNLLEGVKHSVKETPQFQYQWWGSGIPPKFYLRFALDDLPARIQKNNADIINDI